MADPFHGLIKPGLAKPAAEKILVVAGEESGDIYAAQITRSLKKIIEGLRVEGIGGGRMRQAGGTTFFDVTEMSSVGLGSMAGRFRFFFDVLGKLKEKAAAGEYDAIVLIDYPEFNLRLARAAEQSATPVFYYVCPQVWAWRRGRVKTIKKHVDLVVVAFPFEEEFYIRRGVNAHFVGHPLLDELKPVEDRAALRAEMGAGMGHTLLGLVPGSRQAEVARMLPEMLDAVKIIRAKKPVKVVIPAAESIDPSYIREKVEADGVEAAVVRGRTWEVMSACDFLVCKSGTSTLQAAIAGTPMVIVYKADALSYFLAKLLSHVKWAGLPNLIAGREIVPELIQRKATAKNIAETAIPFLEDAGRRERARAELEKVRESLGEPGAADRAARIMADYLRKLKQA